MFPSHRSSRRPCSCDTEPGQCCRTNIMTTCLNISLRENRLSCRCLNKWTNLVYSTVLPDYIMPSICHLSSSQRHPQPRSHTTAPLSDFPFQTQASEVLQYAFPRCLRICIRRGRGLSRTASVPWCCPCRPSVSSRLCSRADHHG